MRTMLKSKIHRARITSVNLDYEGSVALDNKLMLEADILPHEQVHILNVNNGQRFTTYAIEGRDGEIGLNGAAARLAQKNDIVIILTYSQISDDEARNMMPKLVYVDERNSIMKTSRAIGALSLGD
jgi:aspartate 1-decarboxylase